MKKWLENAKDSFLDAVEVFVNEFLYQWRQNVSPSKLLGLGIILIITVGLILSNQFSQEADKPAPATKEKSSVETAPPPEPRSGITLDDKAQAMQTAHDFIKNYSTYRPKEPLAEKIKPYASESFYLEQKEADSQARPTFEVYESKVLSVEKGFIEPMDDDLYWTGNVELETTNAAGQKKKEKLLYAITLIYQNGGWKVQGVDILESPNSQ